MKPVRAVASFAFLVCSLSACERGCARRQVERFIAPGGGEIPRVGGDLPPTVACPEGLARCTGGHVWASARLPPDARCSPEGCTCPWDDLGACGPGSASACVAEGVELDIARANALAQLCAPAPARQTAFALPVPAGSLPAAAIEHTTDGSTEEPTADIPCEIEKYRCDRGVVFRCEGGAVSLFRCVQGCAEEGGTVLAAVSPEQGAALLCRR